MFVGVCDGGRGVGGECDEEGCDDDEKAETRMEFVHERIVLVEKGNQKSEV